MFLSCSGCTTIVFQSFVRFIRICALLFSEFMIYLNHTQERAILKLYSDEVIKLLDNIYECEFAGTELNSLLQEGHISALRLTCHNQRTFANQLWKDLLGSPMSKVLYETVLNYIQGVDENLHKYISLTSENVRTSSFGLVLQHLDAILELIDIEYALENLKKISKTYEKICSKLSDTLHDVENEEMKKRVVLRTIPFFGKMACMDLLKVLYDSTGCSEFIEKIHPGFLIDYELQDFEREKPQSVVKFYPSSVCVSLLDVSEDVIDVDLAWEDLPRTGMRKYLWDILEHKSFVEEPIVLRGYQKELAKDAVNGSNCIISAPTGSGKTIVAAHIVKDHIMKRFNKEYYKVLFLVNSTPILEQQTAVIKRFLQHKFEVGYTSGIQNDPVHILIETKDVLICTPQIIVNLLLDAEEGSHNGREPFTLSKFSLIIFDECHNTKKLSPYAELMQRYHWMKYAGRHNRLPQIVGLTASLGVGSKSKELDKAVEHIVTTCAKLDCQIITRVKQSATEMKDFVTQASDGIYKLEDSCATRRTFSLVLQKFMNKIEETARILLQTNQICRTTLCKPKFTNSNSVRVRDPPCPSTEMYESFISCHLSSNIPESSIAGEVKKVMTLYFEVLLVFCRALDIHRNFSSEIALASLQKEMNELEIPNDLLSSWKSTELLLRSSSTNTCEMIDKVVELLEGKATSNPDFRAIIFVKTRSGTTFLSNILNKRVELQKLQVRSEALFGTNKQGCVDKINRNEQSEIITRFTNGTIKVLIATSTAEEGLDIRKCNLVIKYNYVTNEIAHVQRRGRGRAADAQCVFITTCSLQQSREESNCMKEKLMSEALAFLQPHVLQEKVQLAITNEIDSIKKLKALKARNMTRNVSQSYIISCCKCDSDLCRSEHIKVHARTLYVATNPDMRKKYKRLKIPDDIVASNKYGGIANILCNNSECGNQLGKIHSIDGVEFPSLAARSIVIKYTLDNTERREKKAKWSMILSLFQPSNLSTYDFANLKKTQAETLSFNEPVIDDLVKLGATL